MSLPIVALSEIDSFKPAWRNLSTPNTVGLIGNNLLAFAPAPNRLYSYEVDLISSIPVPSLDSDYIQVGREHLDGLLCLSQHIACFKMGGQEFLDTVYLLKEFNQMCTGVNAKFNADAFYGDSLYALRESNVNHLREEKQDAKTD